MLKIPLLVTINSTQYNNTTTSLFLQGDRKEANVDNWGENLQYMKDEKDEYKCPACGEAAYYDSCYGQQLFIFCPWCGHDTRTEAKNDK